MAQNAFNLTAQINLRGPSNVKKVVSDIRRQLGSVSVKIDPKISPNIAKNIKAVDKAFRNLNTTLSTTKTNADTAATSLQNLSQAINAVGARSAQQNLNATSKATQNLSKQSKQAASSLDDAANGIEKFGRQSALAVRRFAALGLVTGVIYRVVNAVQDGVSAFIDFDKELIRLKQVTGASSGSINVLSKSITDLSVSLGVASKDLTEVAVTLSQAGLTISETEAALQALAKSALAPSFDNLNNTVEGSIALMRQFKISSNELEGALSSINAVSKSFAVESSDLISAIQRTGGVFANASKGVSSGTDSLNEFLAIFTSVRQTTRESAETIATGLRTIFTRIQRGSTIENLKEFNIELTDLEGKFVGPFEAIKRLSEGLRTLDPRDIRFSQIVEELGGFRQIGKVIPLIQQFAVAQQALNVAQEGSGSLAKDTATAQLSLANQIAKVRQEFQALIRSVGNSETFRSFLSLALDLASGLIKLADAAKNVLPAIATIATIRGVSALSQFSRGFLGGFGSNRNTRRFSTGGVVPGTGSGDKVPAMLEPGEVVINKKAAQKYGRGNLVKLNSGKIKNLLQLKPDLEKYYDTESIADSYSSLVIQRPQNKTSFKKSREQYRSEAEKIWAEASSINKKSDINAANRYIKQKTKIDPGFYDQQELDPSNTSPRRFNRIQGALAEKTVRGQTKGLSKLPNRAGADFVYSNSDGKKFIEVKNKLTSTDDKELASKALLGYAYVKGLPPSYFKNKKLDNISGLNIELRSTNIEDIEQFMAGSPGGIQLPKQGRGKSGARGARDKIRPISTETYLKWAKKIYAEYDADPSLVKTKDAFGMRLPPEIALANKLLTQYALETGGAGLALGRKFVRTPKDRITSELRPYLVADPSDPNELGFFEDDIRPFARSKAKKISEKQISKIGKEADMARQTSRISDWESAYSGNWTAISKGGQVDKYLQSVLTGAIQQDYITARDKGASALAKDFHRTRLRKEARKVLENMDSDVDYGGNYISDSLINRLAKDLSTGGLVQKLKEGGTPDPTRLITGPFPKNFLSETGKTWRQILGEAFAASSSLVVSDKNTIRLKDTDIPLKQALSDRQLGAQKFAELVGPENIPRLKQAKQAVLSEYETAQKEVERRSDFTLTDEEKNQAKPVVVTGIFSDKRNLSSFYRKRKGFPFYVTPGILKKENYDDVEQLWEEYYQSQMGAANRIASRYGAKASEVSAADRKTFGIANARGYDLEVILAALGSRGGKRSSQDAIDFAQGLSPLAGMAFGVPPGIPTQAKLTLNSGSILDSIDSLISTLAEGGIAETKPKKQFGKIGLRSSGSEITASYFKNNTRQGFVSAKKTVGNLYTIGLSKATKGYGPRLYDVVMEAATAAGGMLTSDRSAVSDSARAVWAYYFKNRADVQKTPLDPSEWTKNQSLIDPKLYGKKETWPPPSDEAWILQSGYRKNRQLIDSSDVINMNDPKYADYLRQQQLSFLNRKRGGSIYKFNSGGTVPAMVSNGEAYIPPKLAKRIGYAKLDKMNQADKNGMGKFANGGISTFKGPGNGTSDSIGPIGLPQGSYILRAKATKALGLNKGGVVKRFAEGGSAQSESGGGFFSEIFNNITSNTGTLVGALAALTAATVLVSTNFRKISAQTKSFAASLTIGSKESRRRDYAERYRAARKQGLDRREARAQAKQGRINKFLQSPAALLALTGVTTAAEGLGASLGGDKDIYGATVGRAVSSVASYASVGATIGSVIPGVGTALGGLAGAAYGLVEGIRSGTKAFEEAKKAEEEKAVEEAAKRRAEQQQKELEKQAKVVQNLLVVTAKLSDAYAKASASLSAYNKNLEYFSSNVSNQLATIRGEGQVSGPSRFDEAVLENIQGYSLEEIRGTTQRISNIAGNTAEARGLGQTVIANRIIQEELPAILRSSENKDVNFAINRLVQSIEAQTGQRLEGPVKNVVDEIRKNLGSTVLTGEGENANLDKLSENISSLFGATTEKSQQVATDLLNSYNNVLNEIINLENERISVLRKSNEYTLKINEIRLKSEIDLANALGRSPTLQQLNEPFNNRIQTLTRGLVKGGTTDPNTILNRLSELQDDTARRRAEVARLESGPNFGTQESASRIIEQNRAIAENEAAIKDGTQALQELAEEGGQAANALTKLQELQNRAKEFGSITRELATASPEDLFKFSNTLGAFSRGRAALEAGQGAQVFTDPRFIQEFFAGLDKFAGVLGKDVTAEIRKNATLAALESQGVNLDAAVPVFDNRTIREVLELEAGAAAEDDPLVKAFKDAITVQQEANEALKQNALKELQFIDTSLQNLFNSFKKDFPQIFANALQDVVRIAQNLSGFIPPEERSSGGPIYASNGSLVKQGFKPVGRDTIPAVTKSGQKYMLAGGEFIINPEATKENYDLLKAINNGDNVQNNLASNGGVIYLNQGGISKGGSITAQKELEKAKRFFGQTLPKEELFPVDTGTYFSGGASPFNLGLRFLAEDILQISKDPDNPRPIYNLRRLWQKIWPQRELEPTSVGTNIYSDDYSAFARNLVRNKEPFFDGRFDGPFRDKYIKIYTTAYKELAKKTIGQIDQTINSGLIYADVDKAVEQQKPPRTEKPQDKGESVKAGRLESQTSRPPSTPQQAAQQTRQIENARRRNSREKKTEDRTTSQQSDPQVLKRWNNIISEIEKAVNPFLPGSTEDNPRINSKYAWSFAAMKKDGLPKPLFGRAIKAVNAYNAMKKKEQESGYADLLFDKLSLVAEDGRYLSYAYATPEQIYRDIRFNPNDPLGFAELSSEQKEIVRPKLKAYAENYESSVQFNNRKRFLEEGGYSSEEEYAEVQKARAEAKAARKRKETEEFIKAVDESRRSEDPNDDIAISELRYKELKNGIGFVNDSEQNDLGLYRIYLSRKRARERDLAEMNARSENLPTIDGAIQDAREQQRLARVAEINKEIERDLLERERKRREYEASPEGQAAAKRREERRQADLAWKKKQKEERERIRAKNARIAEIRARNEEIRRERAARETRMLASQIKEDRMRAQAEERRKGYLGYFSEGLYEATPTRAIGEVGYGLGEVVVGGVVLGVGGLTSLASTLSALPVRASRYQGDLSSGLPGLKPSIPLEDDATAQALITTGESTLDAALKGGSTALTGFERIGRALTFNKDIIASAPDSALASYERETAQGLSDKPIFDVPIGDTGYRIRGPSLRGAYEGANLVRDEALAAAVPAPAIPGLGAARTGRAATVRGARGVGAILGPDELARARSQLFPEEIVTGSQSRAVVNGTSMTGLPGTTTEIVGSTTLSNVDNVGLTTMGNVPGSSQAAVSQYTSPSLRTVRPRNPKPTPPSTDEAIANFMSKDILPDPTIPRPELDPFLMLTDSKRKEMVRRLTAGAEAAERFERAGVPRPNFAEISADVTGLVDDAATKGARPRTTRNPKVTYDTKTPRAQQTVTEPTPQNLSPKDQKVLDRLTENARAAKYGETPVSRYDLVAGLLDTIETPTTLAKISGAVSSATGSARTAVSSRMSGFYNFLKKKKKLGALATLLLGGGASQTDLPAQLFQSFLDENDVDKFNSGGMVYGNPGIDTNLAALTSGEFVVNQRDASRNLEALKYMNSGGVIKPNNYYDGTEKLKTKNNIGSFGGYQITLEDKSKTYMDNFVKNINSFAENFNTYVTRLSEINIPDKIEMVGRHTVEVNVNGAAAFESIEQGMKSLIDTKIGEKMNILWEQSNGQLGEPPQ